MSVDAVLSTERGLIVAPAGCGKTHLITEVLDVPALKPYLVLTHTTAGVAALKQKLRRLGVNNKNYVVATIDGWSRYIANTFPMSCNVTADPDVPRDYYPELRSKVHQYLVEGHISEVIRSSYSRLLVDEYQDCDLDQHEIISTLSEALPTVIFGDPLQCIFNFAGPMPSWNGVVQSAFPLICELNQPWRWINAGTRELGDWILHGRNQLMQGMAIDFRSCPKYVQWHCLSGAPREDNQAQVHAQYQIRKNDPSDSLLVIGNPYSATLRHNYASSTRGIDVVEPVELSDITSLASQLDNNNGIELANKLLTSVSTMMTGVGRANLLKRVESILQGRNRTEPNQVELAVVKLVTDSDSASIANLLTELVASSDTRIFRSGAFSALTSAVSLSISDPSIGIRPAADIVREQRRHHGDRRIPTRAIGSTLLLKGLEADHALILDASEMNRNHLYVSLSRGAKSVTVFSNNNNLPQ